MFHPRQSAIRNLQSAILLLLAPFAAAGDTHNLVFNGDIEAPAPQNPPPGWTMWGAHKYKDPANFTRETNNPHSGQACLRIHHPAGTAGYIVSSPDHAIETHKGMRYTVTFWARAEKNGRAVFGFDSYEQLKPFTEAPSPGALLSVLQGSARLNATCTRTSGANGPRTQKTWALSNGSTRQTLESSNSCSGTGVSRTRK